MTMRDELARRESNWQRVYRRLLDGPATNRELIEIGGFRAAGRVNEIKHHLEREHLGTVVSEQVSGGLWRYTIVWTPQPAKPVHEAEQGSLFGHF